MKSDLETARSELIRLAAKAKEMSTLQRNESLLSRWRSDVAKYLKMAGESAADELKEFQKIRFSAGSGSAIVHFRPRHQTDRQRLDSAKEEVQRKARQQDADPKRYIEGLERGIHLIERALRDLEPSDFEKTTMGQPSSADRSRTVSKFPEEHMTVDTAFAEEKLKGLLSRLSRFLERPYSILDDDSFDSWRSDTRKYLKMAGSPCADELREFESLHYTYRTRFGSGWDPEDYHDAETDAKKAHHLLTRALEHIAYASAKGGDINFRAGDGGNGPGGDINIRAGDGAAGYAPFTSPSSPERPKSKRVFIVHGHDGEAKLEVSNFVKALGLEPIILSDVASGGSKTIIEKLEANTQDIAYAVVLLTPDDVGCTAAAWQDWLSQPGTKKKSAPVKTRARQNVILELGYCMGLLGRDKVCALSKGLQDQASDYSGVVYISMAGNWKIDLAKELQAAGLTINLNAAL